MHSPTPLLQGVAKVHDLMVQAASFDQINQVEDWSRIRELVVRIAVPLLEQTTSIEQGTLTLIAALKELGVRNIATSALSVAEKALIAANSPKRPELTKLIKDTMFGKRTYSANGESIREICVFYSCQACGRLIHNFATGCPACGFLPDSPREIALATLLKHPLLDMNLVVAFALRVKAGEKLEDFIDGFDEKIRSRIESPGWDAFLQHQREEIDEWAVDWSLTVAEAARCDACGGSVLASDAKVCDTCGAAIDFPPMLRAIISADRVVNVIEDFICLDPTESGKRMLSSLIVMRDNAFFFQALPSPESAYVFRQFWQDQVDLWNWGLDYTFRLRDGVFIDSQDKGTPDSSKDAKAKLLANELKHFLTWIRRETSLQ